MTLYNELISTYRCDCTMTLCFDIYIHTHLYTHLHTLTHTLTHTHTQTHGPPDAMGAHQPQEPGRHRHAFWRATCVACFPRMPKAYPKAKLAVCILQPTCSRASDTHRGTDTFLYNLEFVYRRVEVAKNPFPTEANTHLVYFGGSARGAHQEAWS